MLDAELELEEKKAKQLEEEIKEKLNFSSSNSSENVTVDSVENVEDNTGKEDILGDMDVDFTNNIFLDTDSEISLDTKEVVDNNTDDTLKANEIKINIDNNVSIPAEIYIEEPDGDKTVDLFRETDPFLDDNDLEIADISNEDEDSSNMPRLSSIGTVKPNSMLSKINEVEKENSDIILPTMGLTDNENEGVPIVSENYIN